MVSSSRRQELPTGGRQLSECGPDDWGHFWLDKRGMAPCILVIQSPKNLHKGYYMAVLEDETIFNAENNIMAYDSPEEALAAMQRRSRNGKRK